MIRYGQIVLTIVFLIVFAYLGLSWCAHHIGFCMTMQNQDCNGPFYHVRHGLAVFLMTICLALLLMWPVSALCDRWKKDVEHEEARVQERKKERAITQFRSRDG